ncbi:cell division protein SepF [Thermococcus sp.]|uniref:cell division protein SepF n=1 Tax=Thermococcus sp. TaxID=35749 RepID=UPI002620B05B|nr:cell division protein SepF [Thermococcus sp.]
MGLFDSLKRKEEKPRRKIPASLKKKEEAPARSDIEVVPIEEDVLAKELVKPQFRYLKKITVTSYSDLERISAELQEGNIILVDLTPLEKRADVLEKIAEQIKGMVNALDGQAAKVCRNEIKLILLPSDVRIAK